MDIPGLLSNQPQQNQLANLLRGVTGLLDTARPKAQNVLAGLLGGYADKYLGKPLNNLLGISPEGVAETKAMMNSPAVQMGMNLMPLGMIAYHGSPHTFDKFSLDKIGTGEGAQAYGHGLYLAQSPEVAKEYKRALSGVKLNDGSVVNPEWTDPAYYGIQALAKSGGDIAKARENVKAWSEKVKWPEALTAFDELAKKSPNLDATGNLYKTDIPDEAVARFLDWDKPVPEDVRKRLSKVAMEQFGSGSTGTSGEHLYKEIARELGKPAVNNASADASAWLAANGIPGIRYLDGGSRAAGQGSSNFVAFDPEMIRILERNGQPTGLTPWKRGEWK